MGNADKGKDTLEVDVDDSTAAVWLDSLSAGFQDGNNNTYAGISVVDASGAANANVTLVGAANANSTLLGASSLSESTLWGGQGGENSLVGGAGEDTFVFLGGYGNQDTISNYGTEDTVWLYGLTGNYGLSLNCL